ncbi:DegT/DnrJ/EryC1/StrS family aminotransferase [Candidatus Microgenomates bacterium]|nr:DegT/DnrJ/EryC1/StrS family aminotransferase [Candidatus Microgenomates bacterium]
MIPVNEPHISKNALKYVSDCVKTGWISSSGKYIKEFEKKFAKFIGVKHAITTTSGTTALHLALVSLGIKKGDEVIIPSHTMMASAAAVIYTGATPVFVDVQRDTWNMEVKKIEKLISKKTKAIMPVHIYGLPVDMDPVMALAKKYNLYVIEDAAESLGAKYNKKMTGSIGDVGCFSFYANKIITTGEGGMVVTNSDKLAGVARELKDLAHSPKRRFLHNKIGYNYRMTNMQAALGVAQLEEVKKYIEKKKWMASEYNKKLSKIEGISLPTESKKSTNVYWMYAILIEDSFGIKRDEFMKRLFEKGVDTRTFFISMHTQPAITKLGFGKHAKCSISEEIEQKGLYLPSGLAITKKQINTVCKAIYEIKKEISKK